MSWLTNLRPRIRNLIRRETPKNLWTKCDSCSQIILMKDLEENIFICQHCDHHHKLTTQQRVSVMMDEGFQRENLDHKLHNPLNFRDSKKYKDRWQDSRSKSGEDEAMSIFTGSICDQDCVVSVFAFPFIGGSMGANLGNAFLQGVEIAIKKGVPFITVTSSGGARMQEGVFSLMQMPRTLHAIKKLKAAKIPYIVLLADPTTGGVAASLAAVGDVIIAEPRAIVGFTGARVLKEMQASLPDEFQTSEYQYKHGFIDQIVHRKDMKKQIGMLLRLLGKKKRISR